MIPKKLTTTYFKVIGQKSSTLHTILVAVIPNEMLGEGLPDIWEAQAFKMPSTIYTGSYPQIKINTDTVKSREDLKGFGIAGIITEDQWYTKTTETPDSLGIAIH